MKLFNSIAAIFRRKLQLPPPPTVHTVENWQPKVRQRAAPAKRKPVFSSKLQRRVYRIGRQAHHVRGGGL